MRKEGFGTLNCNRKCFNCLKELCVHKVPLFSALEPEDFEEIADRMIYRKYGKGEIILAQGSMPHAITILSKGSAKACRITSDGQEKILYIFSKNDFFGEQYLFGDQRANYNVVALQACETCSFSREHFQQMISTRPTLAQRCIEDLGRRVIALEHAVHNACNQKLDSRIAALLLDFYRKYGVQTPQGPAVVLPLSREGLANYLGVARETLSRKLGQLEGERIIRPMGNKKILLLQPEVLKDIAAGERAVGIPSEKEAGNL